MKDISQPCHPTLGMMHTKNMNCIIRNEFVLKSISSRSFLQS
jgi:hypothetical protein